MIENPDSPRVIRRQDAYEAAADRLCDEHDDGEDYEPTPEEIEEEMASQAASEADHAYDIDYCRMRDRQWDERLGQ